MRATVIRLFMLAALVLVLAGCNLAVIVGADVEPDGSGTAAVRVVFDDEAVAAIGDISTAIDTTDLAAAGWVVTPPVPTGEGAVEIVATKQVATVADWQPTLDEIVGPGVFTNVQITGTDQFAERQRELSFDVDLSAGPALVFDDETTAQLDGEPLGQPLRQLTGGRPLDEAVAVTIQASIASDDDQSTAGEWRPRFNQAAPLPIRLVSTTTSTGALVFRWIAGALASLAVLAAILAVVRNVLERRAAKLVATRHEADLGATMPSGESDPNSTGAPGAFAAAVQDEPGASPEVPVRLVIVDPLTVLFQQSKPVAEYLLPYVRHNHGTATGEQILAAHDTVIRGAMDTAAMWADCGVDGDPEIIDQVFCEMRWLRPGAREFLTEFSNRRIPVAALTNDSAVWSNYVRQRERLTAVWPWLVSSDETTTKPDPTLFERLGAAVDVPWSQCLYVDTDPASLAAAKALGMRTTFFDPEGRGPDAALGHPRVERLEGFFRRQLR